MKITRKSFLVAAVTSAAALALRPKSLLGADADGVGGPLDLRGAAGESFTARSAEGTLVTLRLERVEELGKDETLEQFRLVFSGQDEHRLAEGTWRLVSSTGRRVGDVFLQPAGSDGAGVPLYRAEFCLLTRREPASPRP